MSNPIQININVAETILLQAYNINSSVVEQDFEKLETQVACAFKKIKESFEKYQIPISFISFADTELKTNKIDKWLVEPDNGKFYYAPIENPINGNNKDENVINDYYYFKDVLSETIIEGNWSGTDEEKKLLANPKSAQLAYVMEKAFTYKVRCDNIQQEYVKYENNVLSVSIPQKWFQFDTNQNRKRFYSPIKYNEGKCSYDRDKHQKEIDDNNVNYKSHKADVSLLRNYIEELSKKLRKCKVPIKESKTADIYAEGFARLIISLAYLANEMNCCVESIPSSVAYIKGKNKCLGVFIWGYYEKIDSLDSSTQFPYSFYIKSFADKLCLSFANNYIQLLRIAERLHTESIKSAKAAIMARNMSHNLGSHVMFYIKQKLESVNNIYKEGALEELLKKGSAEDLKNQLERLLDNGNVVDLIVKLLKKGSAEDLKNQLERLLDNGNVVDLIVKLLKKGSAGDLKNQLERSLDNGNVVDLKKQLEQIIRIGDEMPFLVGLGRFINYLQERQDYIATVATDYIPYKSSINFKDAIYDELKPDLRFRRHKEDESIKGKQPANLLLEYIAYSEGFKDSERIELFFGEKFNGTGAPSQVPQELRQFNIALPGGNLGRQAFFSIMENIIRNTAKHDGAKMAAGSKLKFRFDLIEFSNKNEVDNINLFAWTNSDNYPTESNKIQEIYHEHRNDLYFLGITVDIDIDKTIAENSLIKIKDGLGIEYINENGSMNEDCKGIKEIRISAAWMRGFKIDTDIPNSEPPAVAIRENDGKLQYIICLPKPKKIAIVGSKTSTVISNNGIQFFAPNDLDADKIRRLADFELIVCSENDAKEIRGSVGSRILITDNVNDIATEVKPDELYMEWLHNTFNKDRKGLPKLIINDEKAYKYKHFAESKGNKSVSDKIYEYVDYELIKQDLIRCNSADSHSDQIVYSKHYTGQKDISECYPKAFFLEGVSGGNTTDRLIRQEKWTTEWYVKQMAAGLTKIAIFDERIHDNFVQKTENLKEWNKDKIKAWLNEVINKNGENKGDRIIINSGVIQDKLKEEFLGLLKLDDVGEEDGKLNFIMATDDKMFENAVNKLQVSSQTDYSTAALFAQKGIWAFNISSDKGVVTINGFSKRKNKDVNAAQIRMDNNSKVECSIIEDEFSNIFHFISIHQGILDKIYETLGIMEDIDKKKEVTSELFNKFADNSCGERSPEDFLPQFIIHSGRSHPNPTDMPQKQPFIQFAALDHAVRDCKYTLTELLYSAHYE